MADGIATKKDPKKWAEAKSRAKARMGGKHSARAMQLATKIYKDGGGKYEGKKPDAKSNKMKKWTKEDWGTKSGKNSTEGKDATGERYLPKKKRDAMKVSIGGGLATEHEDIEVLEFSFDQVLTLLNNGTIIDAKTIMLIQYAQLKGVFG